MLIKRNDFGYEGFGYMLFKEDITQLTKEIKRGEHFRIAMYTGTLVLGNKKIILMKLDKYCLTNKR